MIEPDFSKLSPEDARLLAEDELIFGVKCVETGDDNVPHRVSPERLKFDPKTRSYSITLDTGSAPTELNPENVTRSTSEGSKRLS